MISSTVGLTILGVLFISAVVVGWVAMGMGGYEGDEPPESGVDGWTQEANMGWPYNDENIC